MAKSFDIMTDRGRMDRKPASRSGGVKPGGDRDVMGYDAPYGPTNVNDTKGPGLHGDVFPQGSQGPYDTDCQSSGSPGLGGKNRGMGSNRRGR